MKKFFVFATLFFCMFSIVNNGSYTMDTLETEISVMSTNESENMNGLYRQYEGFIPMIFNRIGNWFSSMFYTETDNSEPQNDVPEKPPSYATSPDMESDSDEVLIG